MWGVASVRRRRRDRGAVALIVTLLFASFVGMGVAALTVDVGQLYSERRSLQNGSDAAARSLAQTCYDDRTKCTYVGANDTSLPAAVRLKNLNNSNAGPDAKSAFDSAFNATYDNGLCARSDLSYALLLPPCVAPTASFGDCLTLPPYLATGTSIPYVEVHNSTGADETPTILPSTFAKALGSNGQKVASCSRVSWGLPGGNMDQGRIPITISGCDWMKQTGGNSGGGGGTYYPEPVYTGAAGDHGYGTGPGQSTYPTPAVPLPGAQIAGREVIIVFQDPSSTSGSNTCQWREHSVDHLLPGGFSMLETTSTNDCEVKAYSFHWMHTDPGNSIKCDLSALVGTVLSIPVFDCTNDSNPNAEPPNPLGAFDCHNGNGSNAWYHRQGYGRFYLSGYHMTTTGGIPNTVNSLVNGAAPCTGGTRCISGWFVSGSLEDTIISSPPGGEGDFGTVAFAAAG